VRGIAYDRRPVGQHYFDTRPVTHGIGRSHDECRLAVTVEHEVAGAELAHRRPPARRRDRRIESQCLALEPCDEIVGQCDALECGAEDELAGMKDEAAVGADLDQLGEVFLRELGVDEGRGVVAEDAEVAVDPQVDRRRLHAAFHQRLDDDAALGERLADGDIGEDHGADTTRGQRRFAGRVAPSAW